MFSSDAGDALDERAPRRRRRPGPPPAGLALVEPDERPMTVEEHEMLGLRLLVCILERMSRERAARLVAYLVRRYATCPSCGADVAGKAPTLPASHVDRIEAGE